MEMKDVARILSTSLSKLMRTRGNRGMAETKTNVLAIAFGGGRNGAMLFAMYEHGVRPDVITFADTGGEKPETYEAVERMSKWSEEHLGQSIVTVHKNSMYSSLEDNCLKKKMLPSAAYGFRSCSDKWKIQPQAVFMNSYGPAIECWAAGNKVTKALGYDAGEMRRGQNIKEDAKYRYWFPLQEWGWYLEDCIAAYERHGLAVPPKSACYYCPSSTKKEVLALAKDHPDLFQRAVEMERNAASNLKVVIGLGRHWSWENLVQISEAQLQLLPEPPQIACVCFDGEDL
jgi:hypothetical protein